MNRIEVLLLDGHSDHYIVPVDMNARETEVEGETYARTDEMRKVDEKGRGFCTYRVYRASYPGPQLLDSENP